MPHGVMKHIQQYNHLQVLAVREQPHSASQSIPELEVLCCLSVSSNIFTQTRSAQMACPLDWITSAPG